MSYTGIPYTYLIVEKSSGRCYYGVRFARDYNPSDLGKTYFTSSKRLRIKFKKNPEDYFFEIRKVFDLPAKAQAWEHKVLKRLKVVNNPKWINATSGGPCNGQSGGHIKGVPFSEEHIASMKGSKSPEHEAKLIMNAARAREALSRPEVRAKMSASRKRNPGPNKGWRKLPLTREFLLATINMPASKAAKLVNVSASSIFKYRKEKLGYTVIQGYTNGK
jgi:hypothetical protein